MSSKSVGMLCLFYHVTHVGEKKEMDKMQDELEISGDEAETIAGRCYMY